MERIASDITRGMEVAVTSGKYKGLDGEVLLVENDYALVYLELRSLQAMARIPRVFLDAKLDHAEG
jgi:transcription antitermination factor NusG